MNYPDREQIPALKDLWKEAFGDGDDFLTPFFETAYSPDRCRCITEGNRIAAALYWFESFCGNRRLAYVYAVATHPDFRNRGLCAALMDDTAGLLKEHGYDGILLYPASEGLSRMYEKMGYRRCTRIREFQCTAADSPTALREIGKQEFARLRRHLLPSGGVIQEGPLLDFLAGQVRFFAGDDWIAAITADSGELHCHELLGNSAMAPHILYSLGAQNGFFRTPGNEKPFAMALPLTSCYTDPAYFGLPLD